MKTCLSNKPAQISRRDFLKWSGAGLLSAFLLPVLAKTGLNQSSDPDNQGRVIGNGSLLFEEPSMDSNVVTTLERDSIFSIHNVVIGDLEPAYNRLWYEIDGLGYIHCGHMQLVKNNLNPSLTELPSAGCLMELTVPFSNTSWNPDFADNFALRLYYGSTYWVDKTKTDSEGKIWYRIRDEEAGSYYADATHLHQVTEDESSPLSPDIPWDQKRIEVQLADQIMVAYEADQPVFISRIASGARFSSGDYSTPRGVFQTSRKRPSRHMKDPVGTSYDLPGVPWVSYLTEKGVAFHGTYWHNDFGKPRSHGCINLSNEAARWVYRWTSPSVPLAERYWVAEESTRVDIY